MSRADGGGAGPLVEAFMGDDDAFLRAAAAEPDGSAARLVYADWLDERGDPRGGYVRLRAELAAADPHSERYADLRARARAGRAGVDPAWADAMGYGPRHCPLFAAVPAGRAGRWRLVDQFIEAWHRPLGPGDGHTEDELRAAEARLGVALPAALREWYALAGRRPDVWSAQDRLLPPDELRIDPPSGALVIRYENQGCERWAVRAADLGRDDPPVVELGAGETSSPTTTAFACLVLLCEAMFAATGLWAGGDVPADARAAITAGLTRCDLPSRYWVLTPVGMYEGPDLVVSAHAEGWVYVKARTEAAYRQLPESARRWLEVYN